jgi:hypothetical protein
MACRNANVGCRLERKRRNHVAVGELDEFNAQVQAPRGVVPLVPARKSIVERVGTTDAKAKLGLVNPGVVAECDPKQS